MTGVQTCALPICFPVTIGGEQEEAEQVVTKEDSISVKDFGAVGDGVTDDDNLICVHCWTDNIVLWRVTRSLTFCEIFSSIIKPQ